MFIHYVEENYILRDDGRGEFYLGYEKETLMQVNSKFKKHKLKE